MIEHILTHTIQAAYSLLPSKMHAPEATALLLAIGLQESRFRFRRQLGGGPARGFFMFERAGVHGVLNHQKTRAPLRAVLTDLRYPLDETDADVLVHRAIEHNDTLACCVARLLLWTVPGRLPTRTEPERALEQYLEGWRPGKPRPATWDAHFATAWELVADA